MDSRRRANAEGEMSTLFFKKLFLFERSVETNSRFRSTPCDRQILDNFFADIFGCLMFLKTVFG